jgi:hypothetical protein
MIRATLVCLALAATGTADAAAQERAAPQTPPGFSQVERDAIREYFADHDHETQPLPPGIAKNLQRGKALPPGIAKRQLPAALIEQLPPRESEAKVEISIFGDRIVLLEASGVVVDILEDVFR